MKILKWVLAGIGLLVIIALIVWMVGVYRIKKIDENNLPQFIQADFIDLDKIYSISKFRSGSGHDFNDGSETCRSMKHYFNVQITAEGEKERSENNGIPKPPMAGKAVDIFSPVNGEIVSIKEEQSPIGKQIYIKPDKAKNFTIRLFHIYLLPGFEKGSIVKAGQKIGEIGIYQNTDIAIEEGPKFSNKLVSYFQVMPDEIFAKYQARGAKSREDFIITKEERDADPLQCNGEWFAKNYDEGSNVEHFIYLSGWKNSY